MNKDEKVIAEAVRVERDDVTKKVYIVFEVVDDHYKNNITTEWLKDTEYKVIGKKLVKE